MKGWKVERSRLEYEQSLAELQAKPTESGLGIIEKEASRRLVRVAASGRPKVLSAGFSRLNPQNPRRTVFRL